MTFLGLGIIKTWFDKLTNRFASALSLRNVNSLTVTLVASVALAVLDAVASALVLRIVNYCFPLSYFDFAQQNWRSLCSPYFGSLRVPLGKLAHHKLEARDKLSARGKLPSLVLTTMTILT